MIRSILCALDHSDASAPALTTAADLAERAHASLDLVYVDPLFRARLANTSGSDDRLRTRTATFVNDVLGSADAFDVLAPSIHVVHGEAPSDGVVHIAAEIGSDLIVVGRHDRRALDHVIYGSVSRGVVRGSAIPVLVVPSAAAERAHPTPAHPILVAVDFSEHTPEAVRLAGAMAEAFGAAVELVHVVEGSRSGPVDFGGLFTLSDLRLEPDTGARDAARAGLRRVAASAGVEAAEHIVAVGAPQPELTRLASERHAGLVVLGTHGRRGWDRARLGSVAEGVARYASCPVLVIPSAAVDAASGAREAAQSA